MKSITAVVTIVLLLSCGWSFGMPLPTVLVAQEPFEEYVIGSYRSVGSEPTILRVQSYRFSNLDVNAAKNMTKVMTRVNGRNVVGWGYNVDEATSDAISVAESAKDPRNIVSDQTSRRGRS